MSAALDQPPASDEDVTGGPGRGRRGGAAASHEVALLERGTGQQLLDHGPVQPGQQQQQLLDHPIDHPALEAAAAGDEGAGAGGGAGNDDTEMGGGEEEEEEEWGDADEQPPPASSGRGAPAESSPRRRHGGRGARGPPPPPNAMWLPPGLPGSDTDAFSSAVAAAKRKFEQMAHAQEHAPRRAGRPKGMRSGEGAS
jgi:hypothetical protein